jgi:hypothetical protein
VKLHGFVLNPTLPEPEVAAFEAAQRVTLPTSYRRFLVEVGNGGAGPNYGLYPLGMCHHLRSLVRWTEQPGRIGRPSEPFPFTRGWNDLRGRPEDDDEEYDEKMEAWQGRYFDPQLMNGAIPLSDCGCGIGDWLVVTGPEAGNVWRDSRSDHSGIHPLRVGGQPRLTFEEWYAAWLRSALDKMEGRAGDPFAAISPDDVTGPRHGPGLFDDV